MHDNMIRTKRKKCPSCWQDVSYRDTVCQHCGYVLMPNKLRRRRNAEDKGTEG